MSQIRSPVRSTQGVAPDERGESLTRLRGRAQQQLVEMRATAPAGGSRDSPRCGMRRAARSVETLERVIYANPMFRVSETTTGPAALRARVARPRAMAAVFTGLAAAALLLSAIGLLGMFTSSGPVERAARVDVRTALSTE